jgi:phosphate uptake regulator
MEEDVRKIQLTGKSTYTVSLPKKWVTKLNLKAGDQLIIKKQAETLTLIPRSIIKREEEGEATIFITPEDDPFSITRKVISLYLTGYNTIRIEAKTDRLTVAQKNITKEVVKKKLVGTEILADSPKEMTLQVLISYLQLSVENALRRMFNVTASMLKNSIKALEELNYDLANDVIELDDEVDRFGLYIVRLLKMAVQNENIIKQIGLSGPRDCLGYRLIAKSIERTADHAVKIAENVLKIRKAPIKNILNKILEMSNFSDSVFQDAMKSLFTKNYKTADEVIGRAKTITAMENEIAKSIFEATKTSEATYLRLILEDIKRVAEYASDIAETILNLTVEKTVKE